MKLVKIGSDTSCDIVINSEFVSAHHADLTLLDNGDIIIEDKNSTNGTFVGKKKLTPNQETPIRRGDLVKVADETLVWARIPSIEKNDQYKTIVNIGSNYRNNVVINNPAVSRYHAALKITKGGKAYLVDNGSKNGTQVNGIRIPAGKPTRIKRGDNIICGGEDITEQLKMFIKHPFGPLAWASVAILALVLLAGWAIINITGPDVPNCYHNSVAYVRASYHYEVSLKDNPLSDEYKGMLVKTTPGITYQATAFFLDKEGRMGTNRHVAVPWEEEYRGKEVTESLIQAYQQFIIEQLRVNDLDVFSTWSRARAIEKLEKTELGRILLNQSESWGDLRAKIDRIKRSDIIITGSIDFITVGYPGQYYTHEDDFERCFVLSESGTKDVDLAILQLNKKSTPSAVKNYINPSNSYNGVIEPLKDQLYVMGYPHGLSWGINESTHSLEPQAKETKCSKTPDRYNFEFNSASVGGSSGSPIVNKKGQLVGILSSGYSGTTVTYGVLAKYLKKMYEEEVGAYSQTYK